MGGDEAGAGNSRTVLALNSAADGRPHVTPLVAVWHDGAIHFTATDTAQKTVNLRENAHIILTTVCNPRG
ncbi:hypothetical protein KDI_46320 [Dictyobacter arantiisoli]|uniref:Uncharacterized protein n=1 Tax=Dictyobacter arantiisoli TaxID=2014874 RepID=A0A5A5TIN5_9CHLR|nr:pyridoxamine 5'-phosphate oxidase family protein [Dictyobacter arantiisoli]GCF11068.1 hypothetical protein KDI_46320 [Dictyobacter arantiisoli]